MINTELIKVIRSELECSQEDIARKLNVSYTTINRWENSKSFIKGKKQKNIENLYKEVFKVNILPTKYYRNLKAYALFAGGGGFHLGMEKHFEVLVATDIEGAAEKTHKANWPQLPFINEDIRKISGKDMLDLADGIKPDIIFGGPPCQGFSTLGAKLSSDPRNILFDHYARLVEDLSPKCFLFENVKSLTTMYQGRFKDSIIKRFQELGYTVYQKVLNSVDYGVPQNRERVFFFGTKIDHPFKFPSRTHGEGLKKYTTVGEAINDLAGNLENELNAHTPLNHSEIVIERYKFIPEGGKLPPPEELPERIRRKNFGNTYKRLHREKPALTMVPGNNAFAIHPVLNRSLTPREAARIQTFPDSHIFIGDRRRQCILVGNAVPPVLAEKIGEEILNHMNKNTKISESDVPVLGMEKKSNSAKISEDRVIPYSKLKKLDSKEGFIDLFCGAGGFTIGFAKGGWKPMLGVDFNKSVDKTHKFNFPTVPFMHADLSNNEVKNTIYSEFKEKEIGLVVGGPPCQGFSIFGKRRFVNTKGYDPHEDPRNKLVFSFIEIVNELQPRWFLMENVKGFANLDKGYFLKKVIEDFKNIGYENVEYRILNAAHYGVPQLRQRLVIIGNRTGHIIPWPKKKFFENPRDWQKPYSTVGDVITDLSTQESLKKFANHVPMKHKPLLVERYKHIEEGKKLNVDQLPEHLKKGYRTDKVKNYSHVFKRLHRAKPSTTMVPGHNAFPIHPWLNRSLTVREAARIQTFPDDILFLGNRQEQCIQAGNAFPPLLAELIATNIKKAEKNNWFPGEVPSSAWYSLIEKPDSVELTLDL